MIVVKRAARIDLSPASLSFDSVGDFATLTATVYDEDDNVMRPTYWGWSSADRAVATASNRVISSQTQGFVTGDRGRNHHGVGERERERDEGRPR